MGYMRWTIPNILTVLRVLCAPLIAIVFLALPRPLADWAALILFVGAALTDFVDGWIARRYNMGTAFGKMLDPIADKAMVIIALSVLFGFLGFNWFYAVPAAFILLREVLVSGLREFLGNVKLDVTKLAKWKTTVQMVAIATLLGAGAFGAEYQSLAFTLEPALHDAILQGEVADTVGLVPLYLAGDFVLLLGLILLWIAALLTVLSGLDYFRKAMPYLEDAK
ncbi:CDP-diacylglycerol--glycerol-3-phosphate 3-phosphatidyltransferase [Monaibacterium marinum]|uniref:CDP-diacylglycerol--glycerol-3-phosphate 3-phosphatidyltransferase n=2 Tax=Pontivivens marinum TaxID=1690039 RepID=A0A2C9CNB1_9RHOB|nr:CDP-diacylglycerol--glycerol-3-phosphate 3-phosphatidyltransferase [Monaibacterium marinum]